MWIFYLFWNTFAEIYSSCLFTSRAHSLPNNANCKQKRRCHAEPCLVVKLSEKFVGWSVLCKSWPLQGFKQRNTNNTSTKLFPTLEKVVAVRLRLFSKRMRTFQVRPTIHAFLLPRLQLICKFFFFFLVFEGFLTNQCNKRNALKHHKSSFTNNWCAFKKKT